MTPYSASERRAALDAMMSDKDSHFTPTSELAIQLQCDLTRARELLNDAVAMLDFFAHGRDANNEGSDYWYGVDPTKAEEALAWIAALEQEGGQHVDY